MESDKLTYSAILSLNKDGSTTRAKPDVNVNLRLHRPRSAPIEPRDGLPERPANTGCPTNSDREQLLGVHNEKLQKQRDALVLDGAHLRAAPVPMVETTPVLQVPGAIQGGQTKQMASEMKQAPTQGN